MLWLPWFLRCSGSSFQYCCPKTPCPCFWYQKFVRSTSRPQVSWFRYSGIIRSCRYYSQWRHVCIRVSTLNFILASVGPSGLGLHCHTFPFPKLFWLQLFGCVYVDKFISAEMLTFQFECAHFTRICAFHFENGRKQLISTQIYLIVRRELLTEGYQEWHQMPCFKWNVFVSRISTKNPVPMVILLFPSLLLGLNSKMTWVVQCKNPIVKFLLGNWPVSTIRHVTTYTYLSELQDLFAQIEYDCCPPQGPGFR